MWSREAKKMKFVDDVLRWKLGVAGVKRLTSS